MSQRRFLSKSVPPKPCGFFSNLWQLLSVVSCSSSLTTTTTAPRPDKQRAQVLYVCALRSIQDTPCCHYSTKATSIMSSCSSHHKDCTRQRSREFLSHGLISGGDRCSQFMPLLLMMFSWLGVCGRRSIVVHVVVCVVLALFLGLFEVMLQTLTIIMVVVIRA